MGEIEFGLFDIENTYFIDIKNESTDFKEKAGDHY